MSVILYTKEKFSGDKYTLNEGKYNFETSMDKNIIGVIGNQEYPYKYDEEKIINFANDKINSLLISPSVKAIIYEDINNGGRWVVIENASDEQMEIPSLKFADFENKISSIEVSKLNTSGKKYKSVRILDADEKETFNEIERYNYNVVAIIILSVFCVLSFILGGLFGPSLRDIVLTDRDFYDD